MKMLRAVILFSFLAIVLPTSGLNSRKLDDVTFAPGLENKCGGCPCNNPCGQAPPPPPPPSPPPPTPKTPSNNYCPPPPSGGSGGANNYPSVPTPPSQYIYMNGPPGNNNLYPVDPYYTKNGASPGFGSVGFPVLIVCILLGLIILS